MEKALAHISEDGTRTQTVYEHLSGTARLAGAFAALFGAAQEAEYAAWLHDIGKYSVVFQQRLAGGAATDHSTAGAQEAMKGCVPHVQAAFARAGHHTGLPDGGNRRTADAADATLFGRLKKPVEPYDGWREVPLPQSAPPDWANRDPLDFAFFTRMLYSCLVDADFIDTETFMNGQAAPRGNSTALSSLLEKVRTKAAGYLAAQSTLPVSIQRNAVLRACMEKGAHGAPGLYTLTVPTGGGKTFASLAFALEQAATQGMKRVIYVIPYMSIIDQTAAVFADLLGAENVLADYSCADYKSLEQEKLTPAQYRQLLASENWDAPVVVTTAVLCTATQPALEPYFRQFAPELPLQEIVPDTATLYSTLRRTTLCDAGELTQEALTAQLCTLPQVLCVVNRRKTAQEVYAALPTEGSYCLTTLLCAADRRRQLAEIRQRLREGLSCRVVSTSLIEAGVDVDFPAAYREQCGLDSILQTAGRCNREGRRSAEESLVYRFKLEGCGVPQMLRQNVHAMQYAAGCTAALDSPEAVRAYFKELYFARGEAALDTSGILDALRKGISGCIFPFAQVAEQFHLIEAPTRTVYLPVGEGKALCEQLRSGTVSRALYRKLGAYSVACYAQQFQALDAAGALEMLPNGSAILTDSTLYDAKTGLSMDVETGKGLFF